MRRELRLATRGSALALWQAHRVADLLQAAGVSVELSIIKTTGDARQDIPLQAMAGRGVFVKEIENALLQGEADIAVHSAKDLPSGDTEGLTLAAFGERADPRDALVSRSGAGLGELPEGSVIATSAPRRVAQLKRFRPDLQFTDIRGNVDTRLRKLTEGAADALALACAGLDRLERSDVITERLPIKISLPQVGQGCIAVQCRASDSETISLLQVAVDHPPTRDAVRTERAFLNRIGAGCTAPIAAHARITAEGTFRLTAFAASADGSLADYFFADGEPGTELADVVFRMLPDGIKYR
ncbi:MAG: hydroxymethylbilane synthase [bacterium]|jgi:hydroxymethylbilane synthase